MAKPKKSDLRYGDVIRFATPIHFQNHHQMLHGQLQGFDEQDFLVDVLPPKRGQKTLQYELRSKSHPDKFCNLGKWPDFEIVSRLPDDVVVLKSTYKNLGNIFMSAKHMRLVNGEYWDEQALIAREALETAISMGCAAIVFKSFGYCEIWPWPEGVPGIGFLTKQIEDPYNMIAALDTGNLPDRHFIGYCGDNALDAKNPTLNQGAHFFLMNKPELREEINFTEECQAPGNVVILAGFRIDERGETVRNPLSLAVAAD